jgi:flagellar motor protein MotB
MLPDFQNMKQRAETAEKINQDLRRKTDKLEADYETLKAKLRSIENLQGDKDELQRELAEARAKIKDLLKRLSSDAFIQAPFDPQEPDTFLNPETGGIALPSELLFPLGEWNLQARGKQIVKDIADKIKKDYPGYKVYVDGFTDRVPINKLKKLCPDNWFLGFRRAYAVRNHLMASGIKKEQMVTTSFGYLREVEKGKIRSKKNRRVEIRVFKDFPKPTPADAAGGGE